MTAIVHHKGMLIADDLHLSLSFPIQRFHKKKIFISPCKTFAYGFCNSSIEDSMKPDIEFFVRKAIEQLSVQKSEFILRKDIDAEFDFNVENGIAITRHEAFFFNDKTTGIRRATGITQGCGSGGIMLSAMLATGVSIEKAFKKLAEIDPYCCSGNFTIIKNTQLKPFIIRG